MIKKKKNEHNGRGKLSVKPTKYQRIAFLEHKNFIFRKIICNFAGVSLQEIQTKHFFFAPISSYQSTKYIEFT